MVYSVAQRVKSIAATCNSDFDVRFARAGNQLMIFAPRQRHGIAAVTRGTHRESPRESNFFAFEIAGFTRLLSGFKLFDETTEIRRDESDIFVRFTRNCPSET